MLFWVVSVMLHSAAALPTTSAPAVKYTRIATPAPALFARRTGTITASASPVVTSAAVIGAANALGFGISVVTGSHVHLDLIGTGVFAVSALLLRGSTLLQRCSAAAVSIWATKLAGFLFFRALQIKRDERLEGVLSTTGGAFSFWAISFLWGFVVSLPHSVAAGVPQASRPPFTRWSAIGLAAFAAGLAIETLADGQKWLFKGDEANRGKFCGVGVWRMSQHPNWFGNLLLWSGITLLNAPTLVAHGTMLQRGGRLAAALLSPLLLAALFFAQATGNMAGGNIAATKYGSDPAFQAYLERTPLVIPTLRSVWAAIRGK